MSNITIIIKTFQRLKSLECLLKSIEDQKLNNIPIIILDDSRDCLLYTSPSPRDMRRSRMPSSA